MSSFRIDRQYVSFVTAETKAVYHAGQMPAEGFLHSDASGEKQQREAMERYCAGIVEQARKEAGRRAAFILEQAGAESNAILEQAKQAANGMVQEARNGAAEICAEARRRGYSEGQKSALSLAEARRMETEQEFLQLVDRLHRDYADLVDGMREDVVSLVMDIVRKVINIKLQDSDEIFLGLVDGALEQLKQNGTVVIHVGADDYARYFGKGPAESSIHAGEAKVVLSEEEGYLPGDLVVESEGELLDLSINRQIERIEEAFLQKGD